MQPSPSTESGTPDAASALVKHFPAEIRDAYIRFLESRSSVDADIVVMAVVQDHRPDQPSATAALVDSNRLMEDLGFDSIAITEMVFFLEDLFHVRIGNDEILRVRTVSDLRAFIREKLAANVAARRA